MTLYKQLLACNIELVIEFTLPEQGEEEEEGGEENLHCVGSLPTVVSNNNDNKVEN